MPVMDKNRTVKYIIVAVPVMEKVLPILHYSNRSKIILLDENGVIVKSFNEKDEGKKFEYFEDIKADKEIIESQWGNYIFTAKISFNNKPFCYLVQEESINTFQILKEEKFFSNLGFLLIIYFANFIFILFFTTKFVVKPIHTIEQTFTNFNFEGDINFPEKILFFKEFSNLKYAYQTLINTIKKQHQKIQQDKDLWYNTLNCIKDPFFIVDTDYRIIMANDAFISTFNISPDAIKNYHCYNVIHKTGTPIDFCPHRNILEKNNSCNFEIYFDDIKNGFSSHITLFISMVSLSERLII